MRARCHACRQFKHKAGCIEALALEQENNTWARQWTDAEDTVLEVMYGLHRPAAIQRRLLKKCGVARSRSAVAVRAQKLGLDHRTNDEGMSVQEAARHLGIDRSKIDRLIGQGVVKPRGRGKCRLLSPEDLAVVRAVYPAEAEPTISKTEAMRRLGYCESHITRLLLAGQIRGQRIGERWRVSVAHVEELVAEMKRTGATRRRWSEPPAPAIAPSLLAGREATALRSLAAVPLRTRTALVPCQRRRRPDYRRGAIVGTVAGRQDGQLVVRTPFGDVLVAPDLVDVASPDRGTA